MLTWHTQARKTPPEWLDEGCPASVRADHWRLLLAHARDGKEYAVLAREEGRSVSAIRNRVQQAFHALVCAHKFGPDPWEGLPNRERNTLVRAGVQTPAQAARMTDAELLGLRCLGTHGLRIIRAWLSAGA
jgi:hypothetical protein